MSIRGVYATGSPNNKVSLIQQLYQVNSGVFYVWSRTLDGAGDWSPWHLVNGNDFTSYMYDSVDTNEKYVKIASQKISAKQTYYNYNMMFDIYSTIEISGTVISNLQGKLCVSFRIDSNFVTPQALRVFWMSVGTEINTQEWFAAYDSTNHNLELWKKVSQRYESYRVVLTSSSQRGILANFDNLITMYYLKGSSDDYNSANYSKIVLSTTCDSTSVNQLDFGNAIATNYIDTSKIPSTTAYGVTRTNNGSGYISFVGTNTASGSIFLVLMASRTLSAGTYTFTHNGVAKSGSLPSVYQLYKNGTYLRSFSPSEPLTIDANGQYGIGAAISKGATVNVTYRPMLEKGSAAHNYVMYTGGTGTLNSDLANAVNGSGWQKMSTSSSNVKSGTIYYKKIGNIINIYSNDLVLASTVTSTSATIATASESIRPILNPRYGHCELIGSIASEIKVSISTNGNITLDRTVGLLPKDVTIIFNIMYMI